MSAKPSKIIVPDPDELRATIRTRAAELRALRRLLRLAEAAYAARLVSSDQGQGRRQPKAGGPDAD